MTTKASILDYTAIGIIYNPVSTGKAPEKAIELFEQLKEALPTIAVELHKTEKPGHGEEIAYDLASASKRPLIISVSGDGGYNDVINGALVAADRHNTQPTCAVRGAGNANDHRRTLKELPLFESIITKNEKRIDLLQISIKPAAGAKKIRYAHSYAGLGLTPAVAVELNRHSLNRWRELVLVGQTFWRYQPFTVELADGSKPVYDNLVFANINQMAKVATLSQDGAPDDGTFELIVTPHKSKLKLLAVAARAAIFRLSPQAQLKKFEFKVLSGTPMQVDGEVLELSCNDVIEVTIAPKKLRTLV